MIALIDADSLLYRIGFAGEEKVSWKQYDDECTLDDVYISDNFFLFKQLDEMINRIKTATDTKEVKLVFSGANNFRFQVATTYKHNRVNRKPSGYSAMLEHLTLNYHSVITDGYEADDYVVYLKTNYPDSYILCAIDKDVLYQTVGVHYNYVKCEWVTTTQEMATRFFWYQVLVGDVTDGYKGLPSFGKVKADTFLDSIDPLQYHNEIRDLFISKGYSEEYFLTQCRLANMHQLKTAEKADGIGVTVELFI